MLHLTTFILKRADFTESGQFEAYAATFDLDDVGDVILPGAFEPALAKHRRANTMPALVWMHDLQQPVGQWLHFREDEKGLLGLGKFTLTVQKGREAFDLLTDSALAFSIRFEIAPNGSFFKNGIRYIKSISQLVEVSVVSVPANTEARLIALKKCNTHQLRSFEKMLIKSAGFSKTEATAATCGHWDIGDNLEPQLITLLQKLTNNIERSL